MYDFRAGEFSASGALDIDLLWHGSRAGWSREVLLAAGGGFSVAIIALVIRRAKLMSRSATAARDEASHGDGA